MENEKASFPKTRTNTRKGLKTFRAICPQAQDAFEKRSVLQKVQKDAKQIETCAPLPKSIPGISGQSRKKRRLAGIGNPTGFRRRLSGMFSFQEQSSP